MSKDAGASSRKALCGVCRTRPVTRRGGRCEPCYRFLKRHGEDRVVGPASCREPDRRWQRLGDEVGTLSFAEWCAVSGYTPGARRYVEAQG